MAKYNQKVFFFFKNLVLPWKLSLVLGTQKYLSFIQDNLDLLMQVETERALRVNQIIGSLGHSQSDFQLWMSSLHKAERVRFE